MEIVAIIPSVEDRIEYVIQNYDLDDIDIEKFNETNLSEYKSNVTEYISGFVIKKLSCKVSCDPCRQSLIKQQPTESTSLITVKDYGNFLVYPSDAVKKTVENYEKVI